MTDPKHLQRLEWLVDSRSRIHRLLLHIYSAKKGATTSDQSQVLQFQMLVAIGFALWRAAFLADGDRSPLTIDEKATNFLETLIRDNAIGYAQDRTNKEWTIGYYLNDAYFRLAYFHEKLHTLKETHAQRVVAFLDAQSTKTDVEPNADAAWDNAYEATLDAFKEVSGLA